MSQKLSIFPTVCWPKHLICIPEHFKPGKLNADDRWKPVESHQNKSEEVVQCKRKFKTMEDVIQVSNIPANHKTYHVPPGLNLAPKNLST